MSNFFVKSADVMSIKSDFNPSSDYTKFSIDGNDGYIILKEHLDKFLDNIGCEVEKTANTEYDGLYMISALKKIEKERIEEAVVAVAQDATPEVPIIPEEKLEVKILQYNGEDGMKEYINKKLTELSIKIKKSINVYNPSGCYVTLPKKDTKFIGFYIGAYPQGSNTENAIDSETAWGVSIKNDIFVPNIKFEGEDVIKIETPEDDTLGIIYKQKHIFIYADLTKNNDKHKKIFDKYIIALLQYYTEGKITKEDMSEIYAKSFVDVCTKRKNENYEKLKIDYDKYLENVRSIQLSLTEAIRRQVNSAELLKRLEEISNNNKFDEKYTKMYKDITKNKRIKNLQIVGDNISFKTDMIYCTDPRTGHVHEIGEFKILVNIVNSQVKFQNLTRQTAAHDSSSQAPHVFSGGNACWGNAADTIPSLVAGMEYEALVMFLFVFLESVNIDDPAGSKIYKWPIVGETKEQYNQRIKISKERTDRGDSGWFKVKYDDKGNVVVDSDWDRGLKK